MEGLDMKPDPQLWYGKRVLITGHTGFKGTWLSLYLSKLERRCMVCHCLLSLDHSMIR